MGKKWKVAVVGCGSFANGQYFKNISKEANAECVAAVDIVLERAEEACKKYNIPNASKNVILTSLSMPLQFRLTTK